MQRLSGIKIEEKIWEYKTIYTKEPYVNEYKLGLFSTKVNEACKQGYEIAGGLTIVRDEYGNYIFVQAIKRKIVKI